MRKDDLKSKIDVCFNQVTSGIFYRVYGQGWFTRELAPYMMNIRQYATDEKLIAEYERFIAHNKSFSNADTTICAKILLFDERYSSFVKEADKQLLKRLLYFRNECSHSVQDISESVYQDGINSIRRAEQIFLQNSNVSSSNTANNEVKQYYDRVRTRVNKVMDWFERILFVVALVGAILGTIFIIQHRDDNFKWWLSKGLILNIYCYLVCIRLTVGEVLRKLREEKKYVNSTSRIHIVILNIKQVIGAVIKNVILAVCLFITLGIGVLLINLVEWLLGLVINGISFSSMGKAVCVCFVYNYYLIITLYYNLKYLFIRHLNKKIQANPKLLFICPKCKTKMFVENGKKKVLISCPNCKKQFIRRRLWRNLFSSKK